MEKTLSIHGYGVTHTFEVAAIDELSSDYFVWNIGRHNFPFPGFVPFAKAGALEHHVDLGSLKAVEMPSEEIAAAILYAAGRGQISKAKAVRMMTE